MSTNVLAPRASGPRRKHSAKFKAKHQAIAARWQPGVSIAAVALANQLNANFLRGWIKAHRDQQQASIQANPGIDRRSESANTRPPTLIRVTSQTPDAPPSGDIQIEIHRQQTVFQITWPVSQATACAQRLREVLR